MTSKQFLGSLAVVAGFAVLGTGCGSKNTTGSGGTTSSSTATSSSKATTGTSKTTVTSSTATGGGMGHDIGSAVSININDPATSGTFVDATMTHDFYTFMGKAGERIVIVVSATGAQTGANPAATDPAFGLIGSGKDPTKPLSYQVGGWPDFGQAATLFVQLPADGQYYLDLSDCNAFFMMGCPNPSAGISDLGYSLIVADTSKLTVPEALATTANATEATSLAITYMADPQQAGSYYDAIMGGAFSAPGEEHVFSFKPPATPMVGSTARAEFYVQPIGTGGQGGDLSDANIKVWVTDSTGKEIAADDQNNYPTNSTTYTPLEFSTPYTVGSQYYLHVKDTNAAGSKTTSFYFIDHYLNPLIDVSEKGTTLNSHSTFATAEALTAQGTAKDFYTVDGTIASAAAVFDTDFYSFAVPTGVTTYSLSCDSARSGSGLGGFTATLFKKDGITSFATATETATTDLVAPTGGQGGPLPTGVAVGDTIFLSTTATLQDPTNTGNAYRCYVFFQ